jgi:membrane protease subunit (stomatin/prohibitin family)
MSSSQAKKQDGVFRGIYEFEDPSGALLAAKVPHTGSADLFEGTVVVVKPQQCAIFVYEGKIADVFGPGTHKLKTENIPILTRLANWRLGFQSPLRCELIFLNGQLFTARRWGTSQPAILPIEGVGAVPIRGFGNYSVRLLHPQHFYMEVFGSRSAFSISDLEDHIQGELIEQLPKALSIVKSVDELSAKQNEVSERLQELVEPRLKECGIGIDNIQVLSLLPPKEVMEALDAKMAIQMIGNQKEYLLYKAAQSLASGEGANTANDPMHMMMGLMLGKGMLGSEEPVREVKTPTQVGMSCRHCFGSIASAEYRFCPHCGKAQGR